MLPSTTLALLPHRTVLAAALQDHSPFIISTSLLKPTNIVSTTIHISPINKLRVVDVPSMSKHSTACLRRLRVHDERSKSVIYYRTYLPRCASGYTPHGQAVRERERDIFISPWLQVRVTGPRHHLAGSLLTKRRGHDEKGIFTWVTGMVV